MTRLCVVGNSHITCLKMACSEFEEVGRGARMTFFGSRGSVLRGLRLVGNVLVPTNPMVRESFARTAGDPRIDLRQYDAFLIVDLGVSWLVTARIYATHRLAEHVRADELVASEACLAQAADDLIGRSYAYELARLVRSRTLAPIHLLAAPQPSAAIASVEEWRGIWDDLDIRRYLYRLFCESLARTSANADFTVGRQPEETLIDGVSKGEFAMSAVRPEDFQHLNARYGALVLQELLPRFRGSALWHSRRRARQRAVLRARRKQQRAAA